VILTGIAGFAACYIGLAAFVEVAITTTLTPFGVFAGMLVLRGLAGVFYAAVPATSAALVADHVPVPERPKAMAALGAASALGIVIGPATAGMLARGGLALPLFLIGILPTIGLVVLWRVLPAREHHAPPPPTPLGLFDPRLRHAMVTAFSAMGSVSVAQVIVGFYAIDRLALSPVEGAQAAGIALTCVGVALIAAQLVMRRLAWPAERLIRVGMIVGAAGFAGAALATSAPMLWISYAVAAFGMGWVFPSVVALATSVVSADEQGASAGTVSAAQGMGVVVGPLVGTLVYAIDPRAPFVLIAVALVVGATGSLRRSPIVTSGGA
jgi:MFS family permease